MSSKVYVAGGTGMVGSAIIRKLKEKGAASIISTYHRREPNVDGVDWHQLDLTDQHAVEEFFQAQKPDYVYLAAAKVGGIQANNQNRADFLYDNLQIQNNIIHSSTRNDVAKLLFLGSSCIYPRDCPQPIREEYLLTGPLEYTNEPYAIAKIAGMKLCESFNLQYGTNFISIMPTNLYGPGDSFDLETSHVLPAMLRKFHLAKLAQQGNWQAIEQDEATFGPIPNDIRTDLGLSSSSVSPTNQTNPTNPTNLTNPTNPTNQTNQTNKPKIRLWGTGTPKREFLHVDDLADASLHFMGHADFSDLQNVQGLTTGDEIRNTHVNVGTGQDVTIAGLAEIIQHVVGFSGEVQWDRSKPDGTPRKLLDVSKASQLGWQARTGLQEGIGSMYQWYCAQSKAQFYH